MTRSHAYRGYASIYNVGTIISYNPELHLKDTEFAIKNKLKGLLTESKGFTFVTKLRLERQNVERDDETKYRLFLVLKS